MPLGCLCAFASGFFFCFAFSPALPHYKLFETQAQLIVVTEEFGIRWDLIQKDLRHLQRALCGGRRRETKTRMRGLDCERKKTPAEEGRASLVQTSGNKVRDKSWVPEPEHGQDVKLKKNPPSAVCMANVNQTNPAHAHHLAPICVECELVTLTYNHYTRRKTENHSTLAQHQGRLT